MSDAKTPDPESQRPQERLTTAQDKYLAGKDTGVTLSPDGRLGFNEPTLDLAQSLTGEAPGAIQSVHRHHEALLIPVKAGSPMSVELTYGSEGRTAHCPGRQAIFRTDVPESKRGTVRLITTVRTKEEEPQWGPCLAVSFKGAVRVKSKQRKGKGKGKKKGSGDGQTGAAGKKAQGPANAKGKSKGDSTQSAPGGDTPGGADKT